ncbi:Ubiquitin-like domain-containing protein [Aphelenchoides fujianensis]|nr:Ubiquitin-like domain-containing protein [Aphelenchoides fujianensis]
MSSAADSSSAEQLAFSLRFALQSIPDQQIRCPADWTVLQLKHHLFETCSSKPEVEKQRLIFAGHCLRNEQVLSQIFSRNVVEGSSNDEEGLQVMHLVCTNKEDPTQEAGAHQRAAESNERPAVQFFDDRRFASRVRCGECALDVNQAYAFAYHNYLRNYHARSQHLGSGDFPLSVLQTSRPAGGVDDAQNAQANAQVNQAAENEAMVGGAAVDQAERPADLLDLIYKLIRLAFLVAILLYSSMERVIFVVLVICLMWYVHMRRERDNQGGARNAEARNEAANPPAQPANAQPPQENAENPNDANNNELPAVAANTPQLSAWNVFRETIFSFFASLIPEPLPQGMNVN